jgi:glutathione reductase (NADPH)
MAAFDLDLFVIGGGSGGVRAARIAAGHGAKVAIAEEHRWGGTCVIRGCVPKKLLVYASRFAEDFEDAAGFGWSVGERSFDWPTLIANKDKEIARLEAAYQRNLEARGVTTIKSRAVLDGPHAVRLADGRRFTARVILVATGGAPNVDATLPGRELAITSNEAFHLARLPRRVVVAGGGYIAVEFASIFSGLGAETTLIYRGPKVLRGFDEDLRDDLMAALGRRGIKLVMNDVFTRFEKAGGGLAGHLKSGGRIEADAIMLAIGRSPATKGLGLEAAGVALGEGGEIKVDRFSQSSVPSIYAVGDVTDRVNLTPVAIREGHAFADTVFAGRAVAVDHAIIPSAVFTTPEIGTVGLGEEAARAAGHAVDIYKARFRPMRATLAGRDERMLMKIVVDAGSGKVLGVHILGPDAGEIVQMAAIAMTMGATKADFDRTMALHPSAAEELVTMRERWQPGAS